MPECGDRESNSITKHPVTIYYSVPEAQTTERKTLNLRENENCEPNKQMLRKKTRSKESEMVPSLGPT